MNKLLQTFMLVSCCSMLVAKTTLHTECTYEEITDKSKKERTIRKDFDVTTEKKVTQKEDEFEWTWEILNEDVNTVLLSAKLTRIEDGAEKVLAKPLMVVNWDKKAELKFGEKKNNNTVNLTLTAHITH